MIPTPLQRCRLAAELAARASGACASLLTAISAGSSAAALHVAVMHEPYLSLLLEGRKTIESRFTANRVAPFRVAAEGDLLAFKELSGPIVGVAVVAHTAFYELDPVVWGQLRRSYAAPLCAEDDEFWRSRAHARYASLIRVSEVERIAPLALAKRDRRAWVRLDAAAQLPLMA